MGKAGVRRCVICILLVAVGHARGDAQSFRLERIASGLNQPTYVTQAPGDPANILYFTERTSNTVGGFSVVNQMGKVWRYDVETRTKTLVLDLSSRNVFNDDGLQTIAFSPDFNVVGSPTYRKMYVSSAEYRGSNLPARNRVEEYTMNANGTFGSARTILRYDNNTQNNHTINWIGFDPTATGAERNFLYVSTGDGSFGNNYSNGTSPNGRPSQNPSDIRGKILRIDVSGPDSYAGDNLKNFAIPASNPLPTYNAANPGATIAGLGEVWATGVRNGYRASFDRAHGDFYYGDVGETSLEEVNFLKAGTNAAGPPVDFGWPQKEGMSNSGISGAPSTFVNPFTNVTALNPLQQYVHTGPRAVIGGYVYRGPVAELQGKYLYSDFVTGNVWTLAFDRNTNPASFNGGNGVNTDVTALWQSLVYDPTDPSYLPSTNALDLPGLDHIVSFGEDNAGNVYLVDFGNRSSGQSNFDGQYPHAGLGEIFRITPTVLVTLTINRETGGMVVSNPTGDPVAIRSYSISSPTGSIQPANISTVAANFDKPPGGDGSFDPNNDWQVTSPAGSLLQLSEASTGSPAILAADQTINLSGAGAWIQSPREDLTFTLTLDGGAVVPGAVVYVGNDGQPFNRSDLNFDGVVDANDWPAFRDSHLASLAGLSPAQQYGRGDLDGNGANDFRDFRLFKGDFDAANGTGAFAAAIGVPEPAAAILATIAAFGVAASRRRA